MKIGIDSSFCRPSKVGGAEQFLNDLISGFKILKRNGKIDDVKVNDGKEIWPWATNRFLCEYSSAFKLKDCDLIIFPNYHTPIIRVKGKVFTIIHDLNYLWYPENFSWLKRIWLRISHQISLRRADKVIVISNFVKDDLLTRYGERWAKKIEVIYNPINWNDLLIRPKSEIETSLPFLTEKNYLLSVSAQWRHKNLHTLIKAFSSISGRDKSLKLIMVGQLSKSLPKANKSIVDLEEIVREEGMEGRVIFTGYIDQEQLNVLYEKAKFFIFPSVFEGFGRPVVEALGLGIPTLCSDINSLREVSMGHAQYVEHPENVQNWVEMLSFMLDNHNELSIEGYKSQEIRIKYSSETIANAFLELINR